MIAKNHALNNPEEDKIKLSGKQRKLSQEGILQIMQE